MTTKIFLADDHTVVRSGFKALLEAENNFTVIGESKYADR
jgi:DNA-binding NarL/FixJ family response regulator